jgi:hypothetical protein
MKRLHRSDLYCWSVFQESPNLDFNGFAWIRRGGNVLVDPMPMSQHDREHLRALGGAALIVVTNSYHARASAELAGKLGAKLVGPYAERDHLRLPCERWLQSGDEVAPGLVVEELTGSKTPGELALVLEETTLITGDLVRGHAGGALNLLGDDKLKDPAAARASVRALIERHPRIHDVLVGDGWCWFGGGAVDELRRIAGG